MPCFLFFSGGADQARTDETVMVSGQVSFAQKKPPELRTVFLFFSGGADQARTDDPLLAKQVLYQLSYNPRTLHFFFAILFFVTPRCIVKQLTSTN